MVRGTDGVSKPIWPMNPQDLTAASNTTLDQLLDGNLGEGGVTALAYTNPLFIDVDGNGQFDPPGSRSHDPHAPDTTAAWHMLAALAVLLSGPFTARAATPENFFAALDTAAVVAVGQVEHVERPAGARLVIVRLRAGDVLKGELPAPAPSLSVVQELVFPSDVPSVTEGASGLCLLRSMPNYSAYRAVLTTGPYYQFTNREKPLIDASAVPVARRWLALHQLPSNEQATQRVEQLLDYAGDRGSGGMRSTRSLRQPTSVHCSIASGTTASVRSCGMRRVPLAQRHRLLTVLADQHATAALPMLRSVHDIGLAPFLHQTIVALGWHGGGCARCRRT